MAACVLVLALGLPRLARSILPDPLPLLPPAEYPRLAPVTIQPRLADGPQGLRVGAFRLNAQAEAGIGYDSNLFAQARARAVSDGFRTESVRARLDTDWSRHALAFEAAVEDRGYFTRTDNNTTDVTVGVLGRYDLTRDAFLEGSYRHLRGNLSVTDPSAQALGVLRPVPFDRDEARLAAAWRQDRLTLRAQATADHVRFQDLRGVALSANDRLQAGLGVVAAWAFAPRNAVTLALSGDAIRYDRRASRAFDGAAWQAVAGVSWAEDAIWRARLAVGFLYRDFQGAGLKPLEGVAVDAAVDWLPSRLTAVTLAARRGLDEVVRADPLPSIRSLVSLGVQHEASSDLTLRAELRFDQREVTQPRRVTQDGVAAVGVEWRFGRNLALLAQYERATRLRTFPGVPNYDRDLLSLRLRGSL